jgi:hypothetical protein
MRNCLFVRVRLSKEWISIFDVWDIESSVTSELEYEQGFRKEYGLLLDLNPPSTLDGAAAGLLEDSETRKFFLLHLGKNC